MINFVFTTVSEKWASIKPNKIFLKYHKYKDGSHVSSESAATLVNLFFLLFSYFE